MILGFWGKTFFTPTLRPKLFFLSLFIRRQIFPTPRSTLYNKHLREFLLFTGHLSMLVANAVLYDSVEVNFSLHIVIVCLVCVCRPRTSVQDHLVPGGVRTWDPQSSPVVGTEMYSTILSGWCKSMDVRRHWPSRLHPVPDI